MDNNFLFLCVLQVTLANESIVLYMCEGKVLMDKESSHCTVDGNEGPGSMFILLRFSLVLEIISLNNLRKTTKKLGKILHFQMGYRSPLKKCP